MVQTLRTLLRELKGKSLSYNNNRIKRAYFFAKKIHSGKVRQTGEALIKHPLAVSITLVKWGLDQQSIESCLLHEIPESDLINYKDIIEKKFGIEILQLIEGVNRVGQIKLRGTKDQNFSENIRKMFVALAQDVRVVLIRLADRLHNVQTLSAVPISKQKRIAIETLEIYAPLAERLGMGQLKGDLEDQVFPYIYPEEYSWLMDIAKPHLKYSKENLKSSLTKIRQILAKNNIKAKTDGRPKRIYSLYKKLLRPEINRDITQVHDLMALRIITEDSNSCYTVLGLMHQYWKPVPYLGISDFIAQPKPNGYKSIHTKVFDHKGNILEIQIRSQDMHLQAELGAAAHFAYAVAKNSGVEDKKLENGVGFVVSKKMEWVKELAGWKNQIVSVHERQKDLKLDTLSKHIYVFSPKGDVYDLPENATPIDYAFSVHTNLGFYISSVKVNGKIAQVNYPLKSGDVVEILKSRAKKLPNKNWLRFVKSNRAKSKLRQALQQ